jgi:hypothetical protein
VRLGDGDIPLSFSDPEYHGTRDILWEAGGTTLQGEVLSAWPPIGNEYREGKVKSIPRGR